MTADSAGQPRQTSARDARSGQRTANGTVRVGIGGPVGPGETVLTKWPWRHLRDTHAIAVITSDIYTKEDAEFLTRAGALDPSLIAGVETGGGPHAAIREDVSVDLAAVHDMVQLFLEVEVAFIESGDENLTATFSPELADLTICVVDVSANDEISRKGGLGVTRSDMLVVNKIDLAPLDDADLSVMDRGSHRMRGTRPFIFTNLKENKGVADIAELILAQGGIAA
jgi:urease accessory protein